VDLKQDIEVHQAGQNDGTPDLQRDAEKAVPLVGSALQPSPLGPSRKYTGWRWFIICIAIFSSSFLYGLDNTIVADIQVAVIETFGAVEKLAWLGVGFPLGSIASILTVGKAYGIFNMKWLFFGSLVMFIGGSALCGAAPTMDALIIGRVWAGAGGAGMYLGVLNIISVNTTIQERSFYMALCGLVWGVGCILGPVIGGGFSDSSATWRWAFYINLLIFAICLPVYLFVLEGFQPQPNKSFGEKLEHIDWVGVILNAAIYTTFVLAFTFGGATWTWSSYKTILTIVIFGVLLVAFGLQQTFCWFTTQERRLFPVDFVKSRSQVLLYIGEACAGTALFIPIYYLPLYFAFVHNDTGTMAAVRLLPFICIVIFTTMLNGLLMPKYGYYAPWYIVASIFMIIGGSLMYSLVDASTPKSNIYGFSVLMAIGAGLTQQSAYSAAPAKVQPNRVPDAVGFINVAQIGAIVIALTITGTVFQNVGYKNLSSALAGLDFSDADIRSALAGAKSAAFDGVSPEVREAVVEGIVEAIGNGYILVIVAGVVGLVSSLCMKWEKLFMEVAAGG